jgi:arylsulfatase A-like enzyme
MITRRAMLPVMASPLLAQTRKPNIVFILTDDQGYGDLSLHGNTQLKTPHLDSLATDGARFTRFCSSPVCSPTRSSLLTGRYNYRTGVVDTYLGRSMMHSSEVTLAEMLKPAGYKTGVFGKWHLGDNYPLRAVDQGFDDSVVINGGGLVQPGDVPKEISGRESSYFNPVLSRNGKWEPQEGYCTDVYFREAMRFIDDNRSRPFFCYLPTNAPHTPLQVAEELVAPYRKMGLDDTTAKIYAMIANVDTNVGKLLAHLKARNLERDTIVMYMSDNGPQQPRFNSGLRGLKTTVYEGGLRVPFFVRWPGRIAPGTVVDRLAAHIDVAPTVLEACGAKTNSKVDGRSLLPLLTDSKSKATWSDRSVFIQWHRGDAPRAFENSAVLTQRYKLVNGKELYDLETDPAESKDIAAEQPNTVRQLRLSYEAWFKDVSGMHQYAPPRMILNGKSGVLLTRQDWRGPKASWTAEGVGYWELDVQRKGPYDVTLLFDAPAQEAKLESNWLGSHELKAGQTRLDLKAVNLPMGPGRFEATAGGKGLKYAWFH